jgi:hypothetical protein
MVELEIDNNNMYSNVVEINNTADDFEVRESELNQSLYENDDYSETEMWNQQPYIDEADFAELIALQFGGVDVDDQEFGVVQPPPPQHCLTCQRVVDENNTYSSFPTTSSYVCLICMDTFENTHGYGCQHCLNANHKPSCCTDCYTHMTTKRNDDDHRFRAYVNGIRCV